MKKPIKIFLITIAVIFILFVGLVIIRWQQALRNYERGGIEEGAVEQEVITEVADIKIKIYNGKIEPATFKVKTRQPVNLDITSIEGEHLFQFDAEELLEIKTELLKPGQLWATGFIAPQKPGEYPFYCTYEGHRDKGEEGVMVVE